MVQGIAWLVLTIHAVFNPISVIQVDALKGKTVLESVRASHDVKTGFVCLSEKDIECVDYVCNDGKKYWTIEVNGDYANFNSESVLKDSDQLVLKYASSRER